MPDPVLATFLSCCTEDEFQRFLIGTARAAGWKVVHIRKARKKNGQWVTPVAGDGAGFVDLVLYGRGRVIHAELKTDGGRRTPAQEEWQHTIEAAGGTYRLWRPGDWPEIRAELESNVG